MAQLVSLIHRCVYWADLSALIVAAFLMCGGSQNKGMHDRLSFCAYIVEGLGDGCLHWSEENEKQKHRRRILEINGNRDANGNETEGQIQDIRDK